MRYVIANWKQNLSYADLESWCGKFLALMQDIDLTKVTPVICPPASFLEKMGRDLPGIALGAQNVSPYNDGAHTGSIGVNQLKTFCRYAIIGHSELGELRDLTMKKAQICLDTGITPIVCFKSPAEYQRVEGAVYALEDPDNISGGQEYRPKSVSDLSDLLRQAKNTFGEGPEMIYGGSVHTGNAAEFATLADLKGVLVGNASLDPENFVSIVKAFSI